MRAHDDERITRLEESKRTQTQLAGQLSKLDNQLKCDERVLADLRVKETKMGEQRSRKATALATYTEERATAAQRLEQLDAAKAALSTEIAEARANAAAAVAAVKEQAKHIKTVNEDRGKAVRAVANAESKIEGGRQRRHELLLQCRTESIDLPLSSGSLASLSADGPQPSDAAIRVAFDKLGTALSRRTDAEALKTIDEQLTRVRAEMEAITPNMRAVERVGVIEGQLSGVTEQLDRARTNAQRARQDFENVAMERTQRFRVAFDFISAHIEPVYQELTRSEQYKNGGSASLALDNVDEPYLSGIRYQTMPPGKSFRDLEALSGGEKSIAALALLFAIQRFRPAPFFVIDEVDAALDISNVNKVHKLNIFGLLMLTTSFQLAAYVRAHATSDQQFIQITHKSDLFDKADALIGVYRAPEADHSTVLTLSLSEYAR